MEYSNMLLSLFCLIAVMILLGIILTLLVKGIVAIYAAKLWHKPQKRKDVKK